MTYGKQVYGYRPQLQLTAAQSQDEAERLEIQHRVFQRVFDDRLVFPPIPRLRRTLDCGYGAGSWAVEAAEQYPNCEVKTGRPFDSQILKQLTIYTIKR